VVGRTWGLMGSSDPGCRTNSHREGLTLELDEAKEGFKIILDNAKMLIEDSDVLASRGRYTSFPLGILALEEIGKAILLAQTIQKSNGKVRINWWGDHRKKLRNALTFNSEIPSNLLDHIINTLEKAKVEGLYVDWKDGVWLYPQDEGMAWYVSLRSTKDAREIINGAKYLLQNVKETFKDNIK